MMSFSSIFGFTTILVLVNCLFASSAPNVYDAANFDNVHHLTEADLVPAAVTPMASKFIGDLTIGSRRGDDFLYQQPFTIVNPSNYVNSTTFYYDVPRGYIINYLSVLNEEGSYGAVCDFPESLGSSRTYFSVRVVPNSRSALRLYVAAH